MKAAPQKEFVGLTETQAGPKWTKSLQTWSLLP